MKIRTFADQFYLAFLANNAGASFTQDWSLRNQKGERVWFIVLGHASIGLTFNVQIASDAVGTGAASIFTDFTTLASGKVAVRGYDAGQLTTAKQFSSALATRSAGNFSLLELRAAMRQEGAITQDASVLSISELLV